MDPPDNLGMKYEGYHDNLRTAFYFDWLEAVVHKAIERDPAVLWLSVYFRHLSWVLHWVGNHEDYDCRVFIWRFTFGQHRHSDCGNGYRPIIRLSQPGVAWNTNAIRVPSQRTRNGDKRADPRGRVPDDVLEFPRICGTYKERRKWAATQHPEALMERLIKMSARPGDLVIDLFGHSFTTARVCQRLGIDNISVELSRFYCDRGAEELGCPVIAPEQIANCIGAEATV